MRRRKKSPQARRSVQPVGPEMTLAGVLRYLQRRPAFLNYSEERGFEVWSPATPICIRVRRALRKEQGRLLDLMRHGNALCCPAPGLHYPYWRAREGTIICDVCARLEASIAADEEMPGRGGSDALAS